MQRVLTRPYLVWRFNNPNLALQLGGIKRISWNPLHWRFSLGTLFLFMTLAAFVMARLTANDVLNETQRRQGGPMYGVEYGIRKSRFSNRPGELVYVVLSKDD